MACDGTYGEARTRYDRRFWVACVAFVLFYLGPMTCVRLVDFVQALGGTQADAGAVAAVGTAAAAVLSLAFGAGIAAFGARGFGVLAALASLAGAALLATQHDVSLRLYLGALVAAMGAAAGPIAMLTYAERILPPARRETGLAVIATSTYAARVLGAGLSDVFFARGEGLARFTLAYAAAAVFAVLFAAVLGLLPAAPAPRAPARTSPRSGSRLSPALALASFVSGAVTTLVQVFSVAYLAARGIPEGGPFFVVYSAAAVGVRVFTDPILERVGRPRALVAGYAAFALGACALVAVHGTVVALVAAALLGTGQGMVYPLLLAASAEELAAQGDTSGISQSCAMQQIGYCVASFALGALIDRAGYDVAWIAMGTLAAAGAATLVHEYTRRKAAMPDSGE
jgi:MFS family permease